MKAGNPKPIRRCCSAASWLDDGLRCGIRRRSGSRALGSGTRRRQHWDRLRVSGLCRSPHLFATCLLCSTPRLLQLTLCRLLRSAAATQASLSPGPPLSSLLLLLLIPLWISPAPATSLADMRAGSRLIPRQSWRGCSKHPDPGSLLIRAQISLQSAMLSGQLRIASN